MASISVIGTGNIGSAIANIAAKGGSPVQVVARDIAKARRLAEQVGGTAAEFGSALTGEIIVLALPYPALVDVIASYGAQLDGKTVVDVTNPVDFATFDSLTVAPDSSAAVELQQALPGAKIVKAFNTNFAATLFSGEVGGVPTTVVLAGDDDEAKAQLTEVVSAGGVEVADAGSLKRARELEAVGFLQMVLAVREQVAWTGGFAVRA
ncbi:NADPH-dependent F420 reductase [Microbacterium aurantiacum]|uniref:NADPH-dependent F420 reductase n=1 Tax=Microbacterium aurantiacum TaxID=162393 RepID=A0ABT8FUT9_9MICO|nr:NADPH-dependent F420 reductase [Microbacterium aurantiacum]MDN4465064.1 NADPH-dependent F420 reductase [Microbacterium aurantiacum]